MEVLLVVYQLELGIPSSKLLEYLKYCGSFKRCIVFYIDILIGDLGVEAEENSK